VASAIRIGNPASWQSATAARDASGGAIDSVTDEEILAAYKRLAQEEGVFCEPASAACVAGLIRTAQEGALDRDSVCVCIITGNGLKDPDTALTLKATSFDVPARLDAIEAALPA
jgi:threonine synthase